MITLTPGDRRVLTLGAEQGIGDGFTVPANIPGETLGSCSFANAADRPLPEAMLPLAQWAGLFAFEGARRLWATRKIDTKEKTPVLTDRQRDCILWAARQERLGDQPHPGRQRGNRGAPYQAGMRAVRREQTDIGGDPGAVRRNAHLHRYLQALTIPLFRHIPPARLSRPLVSP